MKKLTVEYVVVIVFLLIFNKNSGAVEVNFDYNASKDARQNLLSTTNLHTAYTVAAYGIEEGLKQISQEKKVWLRGAELIVESQLAYGVAILGHEGGHDYSADRNGVISRKLYWNFYNGRVDYDIATYNSLSNLQKSKLNSAGLAWNNQAAEQTLVTGMGQMATLPEILWYSANKFQGSYYITKTSAPDQTGSYGLSGNDVAAWIRNVSGNDLGKMDNLYNDLKIGSIWQGLSLLAPAGVSLYYLFTGKTYQVPSVWLDTETELTDAGVMYALTGLFKQQGITYSVRLGYGKNRAEERNMSQIEGEIRNVPLPIWDLKAKLKAGYSDTLGTSQSFGIGLEKSFGKAAVGVEVNRYNGYHRFNPRAVEGSTETLAFVNFKF